MKKKVLGIVGSRRKNGNTSYVVKSILNNVQNNEVDCEIIYLGDYNIAPCRGCNACQNTGICIINDDMKKIYSLILSSDILILGSPTYFYNVSSDIKLFIDRCYALEFFHKDDRAVWISANEVLKSKFAVTVAICEQDNEKDMGVTSEVMNNTLRSLGYRIIQSIKVLNCFKPGEVKDKNIVEKQIDTAYKRIIRYLELTEETSQAIINLKNYYGI